MRSLYLRPQQCPIGWNEATPVAVTPLLAELINHLDGGGLAAESRTAAEALLYDLLRPVATSTIDVTMPDDERAFEVATALISDPGDPRSLAQWGRQVGASGRTLARSFLAGTGLPFGRWRTLVRLQASLPHLAAGLAVSNVARRVGYETTSAFVAAFRRETGVTPGSYFRGAPVPRRVLLDQSVD